MAFNFTTHDFENMKKEGQEWNPLPKNIRDELSDNLKKLKKVNKHINNEKANYYAVPSQQAKSTPGQYTTPKVIRPWINIFPNWMPNKTASKYEIGFLLSESENGFDLYIAYCINHYKKINKVTPSSIHLKSWDVQTVINMNEDQLVKEVLTTCENNVNRFVDEGVSKNIQTCIDHRNRLIKGPIKQSSNNIPLNQILYGPPGTGKTYCTVEKAIEILEPGLIHENWEKKKKRYDELEKEGQIVFTTFHQSLSYEDFVEGIKPLPTNKGGITYDVKPGIFKELCREASGNKKRYVLIIDEINRGNVSQIFGELITLLEEDKRLGQKFELKVKLPYSNPYSKEDFGVPSNLYIIGTMNTADRSVEALDTALRRRFSFVEMMPKPELLNDILCDVLLDKVLKTINERIAVLKDREHQIGHSYFMKHKEKPDEKISLSPEELKAIFKNKIVPLLQEYFYGNYENIRRVLGDGFVRKNNPVTFADGTLSDVDTEQPQYRLLTEEEWNRTNIIDAVHQLLNESSTPKEEPPVQEVIPELT